MKTATNGRWTHILVWAAAVAGVSAIFLCKLGPSVLDPSHIHWLIAGGDRTPHFFAWEYYRITSWQMPVGLIEGYVYPHVTSIGMTEAIPLVAIPLKLLDPLLPEEFQFFGWWLYACYLLQALITLAILRRLQVRAPLMLILGSVLLVLSSALLGRYDHMGLMCHWIVLLFFWAYILPETGRDRQKKRWLVVAGVAASALTHPYMVLFSLGLGFAVYLRSFVRQAVSLPGFLLWNAISVGLVLGIYAFVGNFIMPAHTGRLGGHDYFNANLNFLYNPVEEQYSFFFGTLPLFTPGQGEGRAYLGAGIFFLWVVVLVLFGMRRTAWNFSWRREWPLWGVVALFTLYSLGSTLTLDDQIFFRLRIGGFLYDTFRGTGRYVWPLHYLLFLVPLLLLHRARIRDHFKFGLLAMAFVLQVIDLSPTLNHRRIVSAPYDPPLPTSTWKEVMRASDLVMWYPFYTMSNVSNQDYTYFTHMAYQCEKPITAGYLSRRDEALLKEYEVRVREEMEGGSMNEGGVIITAPHRTSEFRMLLESGNTKAYRIGGYVLIAPASLSEVHKRLEGRTISNQDTLTYESFPGFMRRNAGRRVLMVAHQKNRYDLCPEAKTWFETALKAEEVSRHPVQTLVGIYGRNEFVELQTGGEDYRKLELLPGEDWQSEQLPRRVVLESSNLPQLRRAVLRLGEHRFDGLAPGLYCLVVDDQWQAVEAAFFDFEQGCGHFRLNFVTLE